MRLRSAMLYVKDLERMKQFYGDMLGVKPANQDWTSLWATRMVAFVNLLRLLNRLELVDIVIAIDRHTIVFVAFNVNCALQVFHRRRQPRSGKSCGSSSAPRSAEILPGSPSIVCT